MVTFTLSLIFIGFWLAYQSSQRALLTQPNIVELLIREEPQKGQVTGILVLSVGLILSMITFGVGSGVFVYLIALSTISSFVIVLAPLGLINKQNLIILFVISITLELSM